MKRNKAKAKGMRSGTSPYKKHDKRPCQHCQQITSESRNYAQRGASYAVH
jgi:hypothetical protein